MKKLSSKKPKKMNPHEDAVIQILLRMPTKSIVKFKLLNKTWFKIINEPWFAEAYNAYNGLPVLEGLFHVNCNDDLIFNPVNHRLKSPSLNRLPLDLRGLSVSGVSCSNGFLLLCTTDYRNIVYNPITQRRLMIPEMTENQERYHAFGLTHDAKDNHVKAVFAYTFETVITQEGRLLVNWQCRTKDVQFKVYCSKKNEWNSKTLVSKLPRFVYFDQEMLAGVSIGGDLYWMTMGGSVLDYNSDSEAAELISAPAASAGLEAKSIHCGANGILVYCAMDIVTEEVVIWELSDQKTWVAKERVKLHGLEHFLLEKFAKERVKFLGVESVDHFHLEKILYVCHEMQAVFFINFLRGVYRFGVSDKKLELIGYLLSNGDQVAPYLTSPWPATLNGDEPWPTSSSSSSENDTTLQLNEEVVETTQDRPRRKRRQPAWMEDYVMEHPAK